MKVEILKQKDNYFLWIDDQLWMWDIESERKIQYDLAKEAYGEVLVAGYGLGLVQGYLRDNSNVKSITTIEASKEFIQACKKQFGDITGLYTIQNFYNTNITKQFDCIIGDIWKEIVPESLNDYERFKNKASKLVKPDGKILAWGKEYFEYLIEKEKL